MVGAGPNRRRKRVLEGRTPPATGGAHAFSKEEFEALARFRYGLRRYLRFSEIAVRAANLRPQQYQLLLAIKGFPGRDWLTVGEAAERLQIQHNSAVGLADRCERVGLIQREEHPTDRRVIVLRLTEKGESILSDLVQVHREELERLRDLLQLPAALMPETKS
jgi:DNA-binding MarR family transcriptional regulator